MHNSRIGIARYGVPIGVAGAILSVMLAAPSAQRRNRPDNASLGTPVATNRILADPDAYYGKPVTISAGVEQVLSKTAFLVDQRKAVGAKEAQAIGTPILVIAPYLTGALEERTYVFMRGQIVKFDPAAIALVAADYTLDLPPEMGAKYHGQPILLATSVINSRYTELARKPLPPPSPAEVSLSEAMESIASSFAALRTAAQESKADVVTQNAAKLMPAFTQTEMIWDDLGQSPAAQWAREARSHSTSIERAATAGDWAAVNTSAGALNQLCQNCHGAYRERREDGTFGIKPGSF